MGSKDQNFVKDLAVIFKKPVIVIPFLILLILQLVLDIIFFKVNDAIFSSGDLVHYIWLAIYFIITLLIFSFAIILTIDLSVQVLKGSLRLKESIKKTTNLFLKNMIILAIVIVFYILLVRVIDYYLAYFIGNIFSLNVKSASMIYEILYYSSIILVLSFFMFASFFLVILEKGIIPSIKSSATFVFNNFILTILSFIAFVLLYDIVSLANIYLLDVITLSELIKYAILFPFISIFYSKLILSRI